MYEALKELMKPEIDQAVNEAVSKAVSKAVAEKDAILKEKEAEIRALKAQLAAANA